MGTGINDFGGGLGERAGTPERRRRGVRQWPPSQIMKHQLQHIMDLAKELPKLTIQVLQSKAGEHAGMDGPFSVMDLPGMPQIACITSLPSTLYVEDPDDVETHATAFDHVQAAAWPATSRVRPRSRSKRGFWGGHPEACPCPASRSRCHLRYR
ncbi:Scr1 family TA system antitoxin-like transcriptional regulator [Embleya scabrispora]|uniref:Scr1 family TA system antitoxin-like transcriptional regulator n=1 Tax=Embleya scabrispora TaxID=159449 RepID=UPI0039C885AE